jgi:hypothetical protein
MPSLETLSAPRGGQRIEVRNGRLQMFDPPIIPFHRRGWHGSRYLTRHRARAGSGSAEGLRPAEADRLVQAKATLRRKIMTYNPARLTEGAREVRTSEFANAVIDNV